MKQTEVPITYIETSVPGAFGKGKKLLEQHVLDIDGQPAMHPNVISEGSLKTGNLLLLAHSLTPLLEVAAQLATGANQEGIYTGQNAVVTNCAWLVHKLVNVEFDRAMLQDNTVFNGWKRERTSADYVPAVGEVMVYQRPSAKGWSHWGMGIGGDLTGVIGLSGPNGHGLVIASSAATAEAQGYAQPYAATYEQQYHQAAA